MIPFRGDVPRQHLPVATIALIAVNVAVFLFQITLGAEGFEAFIHQWGAVPAQITGALSENPLAFWEWLTPVVTSMFVHGGSWHLVVNMLFLWVFGEGVENRLGCVRFVLLYLLAGIGAAFAQLAFIPGSPMPMIGASGAVAGLLGMYAVMYPLSDLRVFLPPFGTLRVPALIVIVAWFSYQVLAGIAAEYATEFVGGVAWWAHAGGFVAGVALLLIVARDTIGFEEDFASGEQPADET